MSEYVNAGCVDGNSYVVSNNLLHWDHFYTPIIKSSCETLDYFWFSINFYRRNEKLWQELLLRKKVIRTFQPAFVLYVCIMNLQNQCRYLLLKKPGVLLVWWVCLCQFESP